MNIKTDAGIRIFIEDTEKSKIIMFEKPIRIIELHKEEAARVGASLIRASKVGLTAELRNLINEEFFLKSKRFRQIKEEILKRGIPAKSASLNVILSKMVERRELERKGQKGFYAYNQIS